MAGTLLLAAIGLVLYSQRDKLPAVLNVNITRWEPPSRAAPYLAAVDAAERRYGIPKNLLASLLMAESAYRDDIIFGGRPNRAGAIGIAQIVPKWHPGVDPSKPFDAIPYAAKILREWYDQFGSWTLALAAYNWGPGNLRKYGFDRRPTETRNYIDGILERVA